MSRTFQLFSIF